MQLESSLPVRDARALALSADGSRGAALCYYYKNRKGTPTGLAWFDPSDKQSVEMISDPTLRQANGLAMSSDGGRIVTGHTEGVARIWGAPQLKEVRTLKVDSKNSVLPGYDAKSGRLMLATQPAGGIAWRYDREETTGLKISKKVPTGRCLLYFYSTDSAEHSKLWEFEDGAFPAFYPRFGGSRQGVEHNPRRFVFSTDGTVLAAGCNGCCTIDVKTGKVIRQFSR